MLHRSSSAPSAVVYAGAQDCHFTENQPPRGPGDHFLVAEDVEGCAGTSQRGNGSTTYIPLRTDMAPGIGLG
jgi:hypothetical protein